VLFAPSIADYLHEGPRGDVSATKSFHRRTPIELRREPTIYLLPEYDTEEEARGYLREYCSEIFEEELDSWYRLPSGHDNENQEGNRLCCKNDPVSQTQPRSCIDSSAFQSESFPDELNLSKYIAFRQPPHFAFPDHVQNLVALNRSPGSIE
jgi:hypothetical protein